MQVDRQRAIFSVTAGQRGLVTTAQLAALGLSEKSIRNQVARGRLDRIGPGVLRAPGIPSSWEQDALAVCLWVGDGSAVAGAAAARVYGFDRFGHAPVEVSTVNHKHPRTFPSAGGRPIVVHRVDEHLLPEIEEFDGLPVTSARRTILDLCGRKHRRSERVIDAALRREMTWIGDLWLYLELEWMRGRRGVAILRDLLVTRTPDRAPSDSELEREMRALIDEEGLPPPVHQLAVALPNQDIRVDLAYPDARLAIELDSYSWHLDRDAFEKDRARDNELKALGWTVLRFTWAMIRFQRPRVAELIAHHLSHHLSHPPV